MINRLALSSFWASLFVCVALAGASAFLASCSWKGAVQPSVLVVMVENLGFGAFSCNEGPGREQEPGFRAFCEEAVRFTHAYAPSNLSQATVASLLTGRQPFEHGVRHNGSQSLPAKSRTVAEAALAKGYRTSFISGGPPIFRKSGFSQGFETFDDNIPLALNRLYRQAHDVVRLFLNWQEAVAPRGRFFTFLYFADLQFIDAPTTNAIGELRESSYESQVDEIGESLAQLVDGMKKRKVWDSTHVFLIGLNGFSPEPRLAEARSINLFSESTRVTLMIKPARKTRDGPFNWKIDSNVSLADVGATLFEILSQPSSFARPNDPESTVVSLAGALRGPEPDWSEDRKIVSESAWAQWRERGEIRFAVRKGPYLYLQDRPDLLFNTLTDSMETSPLPESDSRYSELRSELSQYLRSIRASSWDRPGRLSMEKQELARDLWRNRAPTPETLDRLKVLSKRYAQDDQLRGWRAIWAVRLSDWSELKDVAGKDRATWAYVAARNLGEKTSLPSDPCFEFLKSSKAAEWQVAKECSAEGLPDLLVWANESGDAATRGKAMENFLRTYSSQALSTRVAEHNYVTGLMWDTSVNALHGPDVIDLLLALPEMKRLRGAVGRRMVSGS